MIYLTKSAADFIIDNFLQKLNKYNYNIVELNELEYVYKIEDSLLLYIVINKATIDINEVDENNIATLKNENTVEKDKDIYTITISELTYNSIGFKYDNKQFLKKISETLNIVISNFTVRYNVFAGFNRIKYRENVPSFLEEVDKNIPKLCLKKRYDAWEGIEYTFIIIEFKNINEQLRYCVIQTKEDAFKVAEDLYNSWVVTGQIDRSFIGASEVQKAFDSWKTRKLKFSVEENYSIIEKNMKWTYFKKKIKEENEVGVYIEELINKLKEKTFSNDLEDDMYVDSENPDDRKIDFIYELVKTIYSDSVVLKRHKPFYLKTTTVQLCYDVFICKKNIAIDYKENLFLEKEDFFEEKSGKEKNIIRDILKRKISKEKDVKLIEINCWEKITADLLLKKIEGEE